MKRWSFHEGWSCKHLGEEGKGLPVRIPDDAMLREKRSADAEGGLNVGWFEGFDYLYTKIFTILPEGMKLHHVLEFEGVYRKAEVWLNGKKAAFRPYGYTNFYVDCDSFLQAGENTIEVIARNADQPNSRWYSGAGIYRPVQLWTGPSEHIELNGVKIRTVSAEPAVIEVTVRTSAAGAVSVEILDGSRVIASAKGVASAESVASAQGVAAGKDTASTQSCESVFVMEIPDARLWEPENAYLYTCRVSFGEDVSEERFGIRTLRWGTEGFLINGKRVILRGACVHHDNGLLGAVCDPDALERRIRILKENGYNALRSAHNPCSKAALEICDRLGVLVMDEYIDQWYIHKTHHDYVEFFNDWWKQDLADLADKDYNHPCVVLYSTGNEVAETAQKKGIALTKEMTEYLHGLDPSRPVTCGINLFFNFLNSIGFGQYSDEKAAKEAERNARAKAEGKKTKERATGSKFFNDLAGLLGANFMKTGATLYGSDVTTREAFANMDIAGYNYGEKRYRKDLRKYPERLILGSETFCFDAYKFWELAKKEPRLIGDFVWAGTDYLGEAAIGTWEYGDYAKNFDAGHGWISSGSGRIDLTGKPLGEAYYTRVALEREKGPYLAVRPLCHTGRHTPSAWKMTNAMPSWSWRGFEGKEAYVEVYARAARVELLLNGTLVGEKSVRNDCVYTFKVPYQNGTLEAVSYEEGGQEIGRCRLISAGEETYLTAEPEEAWVRPGHLSFIRLRFTDEQGITKPAERGLIDVEVENGELVGLGSACPFYELSYLGSRCDTYYGEALAIVRAGAQGTVTLHARSGQLRADAVVMTSDKE